MLILESESYQMRRVRIPSWRIIIADVIIVVGVLNLLINNLRSPIQLPLWFVFLLIIFMLSLLILINAFDQRDLSIASNASYRQKLLLRVRTRLENELEQFQKQTSFIPLDLVLLQQSIRPNWLPISNNSVQESPNIVNTSISTIYHRAKNQMLITGDPGAGKSVLLRQLVRELLAQGDAIAGQTAQPLSEDETRIPIILSAASWGSRKYSSLQDWLQTELMNTYFLAKDVAKMLVADDALLLFIDGVDEILQPDRRIKFIRAIAAYHTVADATPSLVLSMRTEEWQLLAPEFPFTEDCLHIKVQPLTRTQVELYLDACGSIGNGLRITFSHNVALQELVCTPLFLEIAVVALSNAHDDPLTAGLSTELLQVELFHRYTKQALNHYQEKLYEMHPEHPHSVGVFPSYATVETTLGWMAWGMNIHNPAIFYLEELRFSWIPTKTPQYRWIHLGSGLTLSLIAGLHFSLVFGLVYGLVYGSVDGLIDALGTGLIFGLSSGLLSFGMLLRSNGLDNKRHGGITPTESVRTLLNLLAILLIICLIGFLLGGIIVLPIFDPVFGLIAGLIIGLVVGFPSIYVTEEQLLIPNQRIIASRLIVKYILLTGLIGTLIVGFLFLLWSNNVSSLQEFNHLLQVPPGEMNTMRERPVILTLLPVSIALFWSFLRFGPLYLFYPVLHNLLARANYMPRNLEGFLEYAAEAILLRQTGGGYRFLHREYQNDFARQFMDKHDITILPNDLPDTINSIGGSGTVHEP